MNPSSTVKTIKYVGLDVHAETIAVAIADSNGDLRSYGNISAHTVALDKLHRRLSEDSSEVRHVNEAGPTGFARCRHLRSRGISPAGRSLCDLRVLGVRKAPYLTPRAPRPQRMTSVKRRIQGQTSNHDAHRIER